MKKQCNKCKFEYEMHEGSNVCPQCGERTDVPMTEFNTHKPTQWTPAPPPPLTKWAEGPKAPPTVWKEAPKAPPTKWTEDKS